MSWYKQNMAEVWGQMGSGIMLRHQGKIFLQLRSEEVADSGVWGVPGGALHGTEGMYDSRLVPRPKITEGLLRKLWNSAIKEVAEEVGVNISLTDEQFKNCHKIAKFLDNFLYVTFIVDITDEQKKELDNSKVLNWESEDHQWFSGKDIPENLHPGVNYILKNIQEKVDVSAVTVVENMKEAEDKWTQGQVYIDEKNITYDIKLLKKVTETNRVEKARVDDLKEQLYDKSVWAEGDRKISPMMVLNNPTYDHTYIKHMSKVRMCDLEDPILIRAKNGRIMDGFHRTTKALLIGKSRIRAIFVQEEQMHKAIVKE